VILKRILYIFILCLFPWALTVGQILDDSTKVVYGPGTVSYSSLDDLRFDELKQYSIDTTLDNVHRFEMIEQEGNRYQHLGNMATAHHPIFYQLPAQIGIRSGYNAFNIYFKSPEEVKYFDTKSPYTTLFLGNGGNGRSYVNVEFARNISPTWTAGFDISRITAAKQVAASSRDDRNAENISYDFWMGYNTKDSIYQARFSFTRNSQKVNESGGIVPSSSGDINDFFDDNVAVWLDNARSRDIQASVNFFQQLKITDLIKLYHNAEVKRHWVQFLNNDLDSTTYYTDERFPPELGEKFNFSTEETAESSEFKSLSNTLGIKGSKKNVFYNFYFENKFSKAIYTYLDSRNVSENYVGSDIWISLGSGIRLDLSGKLLLDEGNYRIGGVFKTNWFEGGFQRYNFRPSFMQERYLGNHYEWTNNFDRTVVDQLDGRFFIKLGKIYLEPNLTLQNVTDQIYYNQDRRPEQANGAFQVLSPGLNMKIPFFKKFWFEPSVVYTAVSGDERNIMQIPELFTNGRLYYDNHLFEDKLQLQVGVDVHYKSTYFAYDYDPITQQFFLQDNFEVEGYLLADLFADLRIGRWNFFFKLVNIGDQILADGYFTSPYYRGQQRVFDFGFHWIFFD